MSGITFNFTVAPGSANVDDLASQISCLTLAKPLVRSDEQSLPPFCRGYQLDAYHNPSGRPCNKRTKDQSGYCPECRDLWSVILDHSPWMKRSRHGNQSVIDNRLIWPSRQTHRDARDSLQNGSTDGDGTDWSSIRDTVELHEEIKRKTQVTEEQKKELVNLQADREQLWAQYDKVETRSKCQESRLKRENTELEKAVQVEKSAVERSLLEVLKIKREKDMMITERDMWQGMINDSKGRQIEVHSELQSHRAEGATLKEQIRDFEANTKDLEATLVRRDQEIQELTQSVRILMEASKENDRISRERERNRTA